MKIIKNIFESSKVDKEVEEVKDNDKPLKSRMDDSEVIDTTKNGSSSELEINEILNIFEECDNKEKNDNNIKVEKDLECIPIRILIK